VPTALGGAPAWLVPGTGTAASTWVVAVHGHDVTREETLRALPTLHTAGVTALAITYRNDEGAPRSPDGHDHLGATEWHDVDSAVAYATTHGARRVLLYGWSMGGGMVLSEARLGAHRAAVAGVVLDAPALDWRSILDRQGGDRGLPLVETRLAEQLVEWRAGLDYGRYDQVAHAGALHVPVLLYVGAADDYVPTGPAYRLAKARPDIVQLVSVPGAGHTQAYNVDPAGYRVALTAFLRRFAG
jgi:pimeloyl-ACP methyl ester carboxylesterase